MIAPSSHSTGLTALFTPRGVALLGASRDPSKLGHAVLANLLDPEHGYPGPIYPVNPHADEILGKVCYPDISAVPDPVELAILVIPAPAVPAAIEACGKRGLQAAVIISGGFREVGAEGATRERQVVEIARRYSMRVMGPNGIGVIDTHTPLNTTFVRGMPAEGSIAFLSQSGALCGGVIDWTEGRGMGFSRLLSMGNEADVNETDMLPCLAEDEHTQVITLYLEDIKDGPGFLAALREITPRKPVLAIKAGRTSGGQAATASHTGALAGAHAAFAAACRQYGVIEFDSVKDMFDGAMALAYQPLLKGRRIAILTNGGGPAALAADAMEPIGLTLARTSVETQARLRTFLLSDAQVGGPIDMLGGADEHDFRRALEVVLEDEGNDGVLVVLAPQALVDPAEVVNALAEAAESNGTGKALVACLMGEASLRPAFAAAHKHHIPAYTFPEDAVSAIGTLYQRGRWLASARPRATMPAGMDLERARTLLDATGSARHRVIDAVEGEAILRAAGIVAPMDRLATSAEEAAAAACEVGFPVALKLISADISHKTDAGGVLLDIRDEAATREGFETIVRRARAANPQASIRGVQVQRMVSGGREVIVGIKRDATFGPLVMFGMGGIYAEALADVSFRLAPLSRQDAEEMIAEVRSAKLLTGLRGLPPADRDALIDALVRVSWLAHGCPGVSELDINPLMVLPEGQGTLAADIRLVVG